MEGTFFSEASVGFHRTARRYNPEGTSLHNLRCENLKSYIETVRKGMRTGLDVICVQKDGNEQKEKEGTK
jgi:hypothetical protein